MSNVLFPGKRTTKNDRARLDDWQICELSDLANPPKNLGYLTANPSTAFKRDANHKLEATLDDPLMTLLESTESCPANKANRAIEWLKSQDQLHIELLLNHFAQRTLNKSILTPEALPATAAAIEILTWFKCDAVSRILLNELSKQPLSEAHLFLLGSSRIAHSYLDERFKNECADKIKILLSRFINTLSQNPSKWELQIFVEGFRVLSIISIRSAIDVFMKIERPLPDIEFTAVFDDLITGIAKNTSETDLCNNALKAKLTSIWPTIRIDSEKNRSSSGVRARVLGLLGLCGDSHESILSMASSTSDMEKVLFLLIQLPLHTLKKESRSSLYTATLKLLSSKSQRIGVKKCIDVVYADRDVDIFEVLTAMTAPANAPQQLS